MMSDEFIPIAIPYVAGEAQGDELELAVTGWRRHFLHDYHIFIVGDPHPIVTTGDDISIIQTPRRKPSEGNYLPHIDIAFKLLTVCGECLLNGMHGFIYTCDDIYPVNDFGMEEVLFPKVVGKMAGNGDTTGWLGDLRRTRLKCEEEGLPTWDWVCHLPVYFETLPFMRVMEEYDCLNTSYVFENLYFNREGGRVPLILNGTDNLKYEVSTDPYDSYGLERALETKIFVTNTNGGWSQALEDRLRKHYKQ